MVLDMSLRCLQTKVPNSFGRVSLESRRNVWTNYINLVVIEVH